MGLGGGGELTLFDCRMWTRNIHFYSRINVVEKFECYLNIYRDIYNKLFIHEGKFNSYKVLMFFFGLSTFAGTIVVGCSVISTARKLGCCSTVRFHHTKEEHNSVINHFSFFEGFKSAGRL